MLWNIHGYPRKSAGNRIKAAKQDTSSQPAPTNDAASGRIRGSSEALARLSARSTAIRMDLFGSTLALTPAFRGSKVVRACPSLSMCNARCLSSHAGQGTSLARHENQMLRLVQCAVPCGNCLCTNIQSRMDNLSAARKRKWFVGTGRALWSTW